MLQFEWDAQKAEANIIKHGVRFAHGIAAFADEDRVVTEDTRYAYLENRYELIGMIDDRLHVVIYTMRYEKVRLISVRRANKREQKRYWRRK